MNKKTDRTVREAPAVERLDYSKPPPGYTVGDELEEDAPLFTWRWDGEWMGREDEKTDALAAAWAHHKARRDPPGIQVHFIAGRGYLVQVFDHPAGESPDNHVGPTYEPLADLASARAAAWAWYDRRLAVAQRLNGDVVVLVEHLDGGGTRRVSTPRSQVVAALWPMITMGTDDDARAEVVAEAERLFSEGCLSFEGDQPIELESVTVWPRCLTWSDEQAAEVERWLVDSSVETPEVLRGS